ncbi:MAG TPA: ThiF family adenylyltransferase, partial [Caulobacteraceae bacterium]|nr:ThiF family adenylyltransferase [Caulobacteraceae bacterium]
MAFSDEEVERYARHLVLREIGGPGQQKLKAARVLIVGAGGLGAPSALYLAAAGVGTIALADPDTVSLSNLQRQVLYGTADAGAPKVERAADRLASLNPHVHVEPIDERLSDANARALVAAHDLVLDGTDDFATRFAVNAACVAEG